MRLHCQKTFLLLALSTFACSGSTSPTVRGRFALDNIDGRRLPTYPAATPGLTPTILSSTLILDQDGHASITEHRTEWNGTDAIRTTNYTYLITGNRIEFDYDPPCPPNANCVAPPKGEILGRHISLEMGRINTYVIHYNFLRTSAD